MRNNKAYDYRRNERRRRLMAYAISILGEDVGYSKIVDYVLLFLIINYREIWLSDNLEQALKDSEEVYQRLFAGDASPIFKFEKTERRIALLGMAEDVIVIPALKGILKESPLIEIAFTFFAAVWEQAEAFRPNWRDEIPRYEGLLQGDTL